MKRTLLITVAVVSLLGTAQSFAQTAVIELSPEQRTTIREYVVRERVPVATIPGEVRVGMALPAGIELVPVPETWGPSVMRYRYVHWNNRVVLVEPSSRKVIQIID
jgi:Protein of unknown function (DUF1236)